MRRTSEAIAGDTLLSFLLLTAVCVSPGAGAGGAWPQWRYDANRSGATKEAGPQSAGLLWRLELGRPDPAYDHQYRMCADVTYAPIAAEGLVFLPSNTTDQVLACDLQTGSVRWRFFAEGPVRFAPVYVDGKLYVGSDDGYLHCLSASDGKRLWRVRGAPETLPDSRMLVNGRVCSRWPVRGGPVLHGGTVMFGAGIWPEEGVYVCAVSAPTGELLWRSDRLSFIEDGMSDHGRPYDLSLPPHGYLAVIDGTLAVPSGRSLAAWFDPDDGTMEPYTCFYVKHNPPRGTWYVAGINRYCVQGGNWFGTRPEVPPPLPDDLREAKPATFWSRNPPDNELHVMEHRPFLRADTYRLHDENRYTEPVLTETTMYASEFTDEKDYLVPRGHTHVTFPQYDRIVARDLTRPEWKTYTWRHYRYGRRKVAMLKLQFPMLWELASPLRVLIKAGDRLYAGGKNTVAAIALPEKGVAPHIAWEAPIEGTPVHALVCDGKLVVVTDSGNVYGFGHVSGRVVVSASESEQCEPYRSPENGYALLIGWGDGTRALALAREGTSRVVVVEPDAATAARARKALAEAKLFGRRAQVIQAHPNTTRLTPYWANLVIVQSPSALGTPEATLSVALEALRPFTGKLLLPEGNRHAGRLKRLVASRTGHTLRVGGDGLTVRRDHPPEGAADWTHEAGGPENGFANAERLVKWPLGVLWYSGDIDRYFTPASHFQHERHPYPLVVGGRMFIITHQLLHAVDIYTGSYLWRAEMPETSWTKTRSFDSRIYGRPTERNHVAARDWVYAVTGKEIHAYDVASGKRQKVFRIPSSLRGQATTSDPRTRRRSKHGDRIDRVAPAWTEVRLWQDVLLAVFGRHLVAVDRHSGEMIWTRRSTRETTTYTVGDDTLFALDCDIPEIGGGQAGEPAGRLLAIDPQTGTVRWQRELAYKAVPRHTVRNPRPWLRPVLPTLSYNAKHRLIVMTVNRSSLIVLRAADGSPVWSKRGRGRGNIQAVYPPVVTDDYVLLSQHRDCFGYLLDIRTGKEVGDNTGIPRPRTCARVIGNNHVLVYRDAATELYDIDGNRMIGLNSMRSGCTTSFIPAGGIVTAPMLGHGCVCNYPMFASLGLYHWPEIENHRPASVSASWTNEVAQRAASGHEAGRRGLADASSALPSHTGERIDLRRFRLLNATAEASGPHLIFRTKDRTAGYAVRASDKPLARGTFTFSLKRVPTPRRHGNAFFVCGSGDAHEDWIECRVYYGGRSCLMITGPHVTHKEEKATFQRGAVITVTVTVDCTTRTVTLKAAGKELTSRMAGPMPGITHYGYGGANADNLFTKITVR